VLSDDLFSDDNFDHGIDKIATLIDIHNLKMMKGTNLMQKL